ncbi:MAG TPA: hypothetical protein VLD61_09405, partial [Methylomirabilota bacterium]|nr:hypothetical protein [Methylomirabilota bacterium]
MSGFLFLPVIALGLVVLAGPALVLWLFVLVFQHRRRIRDLQGRVAALERGSVPGPVAAAGPP